MRGRERNSCADANVSGCQPALTIRSSSDSRTETSSSTMNTIGVAMRHGTTTSAQLRMSVAYSASLLIAKIRALDRSIQCKRGIERFEQSRVAEWLEQALDGALLEQAWPDALISVSGDEDDRDRLPAKRQFLLEIGSGHARHGDVENQTLGLADIVGRKKFLGRGECLGRKAKFPEQVGQRLAHGFVVIDDRHE